MFLWYKKGDESPIVALEVLYDDEAPSEGFTKVPKDLIKPEGTGAHVYLAYRRAAAGDAATSNLPIIGIRLLGADAEGAFTALAPCLPGSSV